MRGKCEPGYKICDTIGQRPCNNQLRRGSDKSKQLFCISHCTLLLVGFLCERGNLYFCKIDLYLRKWRSTLCCEQCNAIGKLGDFVLLTPEFAYSISNFEIHPFLSWFSSLYVWDVFNSLFKDTGCFFHSASP